MYIFYINPFPLLPSHSLLCALGLLWIYTKEMIVIIINIINNHTKVIYFKLKWI